MIKIINGQIYGSPPDDMSYIGGRGILGRIILPMTRFMRYSNVTKYIIPSERLLFNDNYF